MELLKRLIEDFCVLKPSNPPPQAYCERGETTKEKRNGPRRCACLRSLPQSFHCSVTTSPTRWHSSVFVTPRLSHKHVPMLGAFVFRCPSVPSLYPWPASALCMYQQHVTRIISWSPKPKTRVATESGQSQENQRLGDDVVTLIK